MNTFTIDLNGTPERGFTADIIGVSQSQPDQVIQLTKNHIVLKSSGYDQNPGSRYSGLRSYYPPEVTVYEITEWVNSRRVRTKVTVSWNAGREKEKINPDMIIARAAQDA